MKKILLTLMVAVCLVFGLGVMNADAATYTGSLGDNVTYSLDTSTGVLTISGSGAMENYTSSSSAPWYSYCSDIKSVVIEDGVTSIGSSAFDGCGSLTSVTIGGSVTSIGSSAFVYCYNLTEVYYNGDLAGWLAISFGSDSANPMYYARKLYINGELLTEAVIPDSVTRIRNYAFNGCSSLTSVTIPDSVTSIGGSAFDGCSGLTSITIGESVTSIGKYAFYYCTGLTEINWNAKSVADFSYNNYVFYNAGQRGEGIKVTFGDNVEKIPAYCFYPDSDNFYAPNITSIVIGVGVTSIGNYAFRGCSELTEIIIDENNEYYCSIDGVVFNEDKTTIVQYPVGRAATAYAIPDGVTSIMDYAFRGCSGLTSITIPDSVTSIGSSAFYNCTGLTEINWNAKSVADFSSGNYVFYKAGQNGEGIKVTFGDNVKKIPAYCFYPYSDSFCTPKITSVVIGDSVTSIGNYAFSGCTSLTEINWNAKSVADFSSSNRVFAFAGQSGEGIKVTFGDNVEKIPAYCFYPYSDSSYAPKITSVVIGDSVTSIGKYAFCKCGDLTSVTIGDSVTSIGNYAFDGCSGLKTALYPGNKADLTIGSNNTSLTNVIIYMNGSCGENCSWKIDYKTGTLTISGSGAMENYSLTEAAPWSEISEYVNIAKIVIEDSVSVIGNYAFYNLAYVKTVTIPKSMADIGPCAFYGCDMLSKAYYAGSESQWNEIFISRTGNENLTAYANVIYNFEAEEEPAIPDTEGKTPQIGYTTFTFTPVGVNKGDIIAVLVVNDGVSVSYAKTYSGSGTVTFEIESGFDSIKILVWDSYESMEPLMEEYATIE